MKKPPRRKQRILGITILATAAVLGVLFFTGNKQNTHEISESFEVVRDFTTSSILLSGRIAAENERQLGFPVSGTISQASAKVGERVTAGTILARLDVQLLLAQRRELEADITIQESILENILAGARPEEVAVEEESLALAELNYAHLQNQISSVIYDAFTTADNSVRNVVDDYLENAQSASPALLFPVSRNQSLRDALERNRVSVGNTLSSWTASISAQSTDLEQSVVYLTEVRDFMNLAALTVNTGDTSSAVSDTLLRTWKTNTATSRSAVVAALLNLEALQRNLETAAAQVRQAESRLTLIRSGATPTAIATQRETIERARASLTTLNAQISERTLRAPIAGIVASHEGEVGESIAAGVPVVTLISDTQPLLILEAPELTLPQISLGDRAVITLLALGDHAPLGGTVTSISPQASTDNGLVPYYEIEVTLDENELTISPGLLADARLTTGEYPDSIAVPRRFLLDYSPQAGTAQVWLMSPDGLLRQDVIIGATMSDQRVLILDGLRPGDSIVRLKQAL